MLRLSRLLVVFLSLLGIAPAAAQAPGGSPISYLYCLSGTVATSPASWGACSSTNPLPITGPSTGVIVIGNVSNASSAVATSSTNVPTVSYNYGFNGATWDQLLVDASQFLKVTQVPTAASGITPTTTAALAANSIIKASAGNLYSFEVSADSTLSAAAWWIMIYNATSAPVDGAVTPIKCYAMPSGSTALSAAFPTPVAFSTGITIGVSTTGCFTKTASTHAFISGDAK